MKMNVCIFKYKFFCSNKMLDFLLDKKKGGGEKTWLINLSQNSIQKDKSSWSIFFILFLFNYLFKLYSTRTEADTERKNTIHASEDRKDRFGLEVCMGRTFQAQTRPEREIEVSARAWPGPNQNKKFWPGPGLHGFKWFKNWSIQLLAPN